MKLPSRVLVLGLALSGTSVTAALAKRGVGVVVADAKLGNDDDLELLESVELVVKSPGVPGGYLSNGCIECDALIGRFHLEDLLHEHLMSGGTYSQLDIGVPVELPLGVPARLTALG